tara:strand:+ start:1075 stop:1332 length:258 start_codon:yes stop_codon:yes gene_type:complete
MTTAELAAAVDLYASLGRTHVPVPISILREMMATKTIGRAFVKTGATGKTTLIVPDTTPRHFKVAKSAKAERKAKGLVKNRDSKR